MQGQERKESANERWKREHTQVLRVRLIKTTEQDIIQRLDAVNNRSGYIKRLIREDIARHPETPTD